LKTIDFMERQTLEKFSSAFTLSDMEIFIFPELFYSLVLANICSPIIWEWEKNPWFKDIQKKSTRAKVNRIKQFIMDNFTFNLDLETWGLTQKQTEINRFKSFVNMDMLVNSNALFGYEGDKYYFDMDIRRHFGLDKYDSSIIPYWKTETVEAMQAFRYKKDFKIGAGECVSLACLYAATLFIIGKISLKDIYLMATPLHSQNFLDIDEGIITNNRRILTKKMWFNGTILSTKARRALECEQISSVCNISGYIHKIYDKATINPLDFKKFRKTLTQFLNQKVNKESFRCFLRKEQKHQKEFQFQYKKGGKNYYIELEKIYYYENSSKNSFSDKSQKALLKEIDAEEFSLSLIKNRNILDDFERALTSKKRNFNCKQCVDILQKYNDFIKIKPNFPCQIKSYVDSPELEITTSMSRDEILEYICGQSGKNDLATYTLYTYRQMDKIDWKPFLYAALKRNPVSKIDLGNRTNQELYQAINSLENNSIYDDVRLAQPDEVWNFGRGDGIEKAILLANVLPEGEKILEVSNGEVTLMDNKKEYLFKTNKAMEIKIKF